MLRPRTLPVSSQHISPIFPAVPQPREERALALSRAERDSDGALPGTFSTPLARRSPSVRRRRRRRLLSICISGFNYSQVRSIFNCLATTVVTRMLVSCFNSGLVRVSKGDTHYESPRVARANTRTAAQFVHFTFEIASKVVPGQVSRANRVFLGVLLHPVIERTARSAKKMSDCNDRVWIRVLIDCDDDDNVVELTYLFAATRFNLSPSPSCRCCDSVTRLDN